MNEETPKKTGPELLKQLAAALAAAKWVQGPHPNVIQTRCEAPGLGEVMAEWHRSQGTRSYTQVALSYTKEGQPKRETVLDFEAPLEIVAISRRVSECIAPKVQRPHVQRDPRTAYPFFPA